VADEPDPERLRALEARLAAAKGKPVPERSPTGKAFSQGEAAWRMVIELVSGMLIGVSIGYALDWWLDTAPWFIIVFALAGFAAGVRTMLGTARAMAGRDKAGNPADGTEG
jgi:ATP synthase protein I